MEQISHWGYYVKQRRIKAAAISNMEHFVIIVNGWKQLTIITKSFTLDVAAVPDPPLVEPAQNHTQD